MGLDMYLKADKYVGNWEHSKESEKSLFQSILKQTNTPELVEDQCPSLVVSITCAYWRKANAIHQWFVDNVQDGNDNCERYYVSKDQLTELMNLCSKVLENRDSEDVAEKSLPTSSGFFFGSTHYDDYYYEDLEYTLKRIQYLLSLPYVDELEFYYQSSW